MQDWVFIIFKRDASYNYENDFIKKIIHIFLKAQMKLIKKKKWLCDKF